MTKILTPSRLMVKDRKTEQTIQIGSNYTGLTEIENCKQNSNEGLDGV